MPEIEISFQMLLVICPMVFLAGFVDSVAGGGGLISLPAYIVAGLPVHMALGTNKLSSCCGTTVAVLKYSRSGYINWREAMTSGVGALVGSWCGAKLAMVLTPDALRICMLAILPCVGVFLLFRRDFGVAERPAPFSDKLLPAVALLIGLVIGCYDGFFGPGTGTFLALALTGLLGRSLTAATGSAKVINLCSNVAALLAFVMGGQVLWMVGLPAAAFNIMGNYLGARLAVKKGAAFIRPVIMASVVMLFAGMLRDLM